MSIILQAILRRPKSKLLQKNQLDIIMEERSTGSN